MSSSARVASPVTRTRVRSAVAAFAIIGLLGLSVSARGADAACSNEAIRDRRSMFLPQGSTFLPECRAYELVSPGSNPFVGSDGVIGERGDRASLSGERIAYSSNYPANGSQTSGFFYLATRGETGWTIEAQTPQDSPGANTKVQCQQALYFSPELFGSVLSDGWNTEEEEPGKEVAPCQRSETPLASDAPSGYGNLFLREGSGPYSLVNRTETPEPPGNAELQDATPDLSHIVFGEKAKLTADAPEGYDLYESVEGAVHLVSFLPDGEPVDGELADSSDRYGNEDGHLYGLASVTHAVSEDGEQVFFYHEGDLYVRENAAEPQSAISAGECTEAEKACTIQVDADQGGSGASGGGVFWDASANGATVFFADESKLKSDSNATINKPDLYEYDLETGVLTDLTPGTAGEPADARGFSGASEDGSYVYFVAESDLTGAQRNSQDSEAKTRKPNLYLYHGGTMTFVATLNAEGDSRDWQETPLGDTPQTNDGSLSARVSPNGEYAGFGSVETLTGFDNAPGQSGECETTERTNAATPCSEVFLYDAASNELRCASCFGGQPTGNTELPETTGLTFKAYFGPGYLSRNVLDDGQMFFTTPDTLVAEDGNNADDVYEYREGQIDLISTGMEAAGGAVFYDASANGENVFFVTAQRLVGVDTENVDSIYDARVDGGFAEPPASSVPCASREACAGTAPAGAAFGAPSSIGFTGPGNAVPPRKHKAKALTRAQKLARALKKCRTKPKRRRASCKAKARKRFGAKKKAKKKKTGKMSKKKSGKKKSAKTKTKRGGR